jgi:hypothetical protein
MAAMAGVRVWGALGCEVLRNLAYAAATGSACCSAEVHVLDVTHVIGGVAGQLDQRDDLAVVNAADPHSVQLDRLEP